MEVVEILTGGIEMISRISAEWSALCSEGASGTPFLRPEWFSAFVRNFEKRVSLVTVNSGGKLRAVLPLVRKRGSLNGIPARKLQAVFNLNTQRFDLIHGADETERKMVVASVWKAISETPGWDVLEIRLARRDSWLTDVVALAEGQNHRVGIWAMDSAPYIELPQLGDGEKSIAEFFSRFSKNRRTLLKKKLRSLGALGETEFTVTRGYRRGLMQRYFELESKGWKGRAGTSVASDPKVAKLHDDFARAVAVHDALFFHELKLNGETIAMYISIMFDRQTTGWKMSYDERYAQFSPGSLLFAEVLKDSIRNGSIEIDQLSPATYNKNQWATGEREHVAFYIFQKGLIGSLLWHWKIYVIGGLRTLKSRASATMSPAAGGK
jgi:CelD/BcsL family acetyltransferase involved in cellulose biosynthesis